VSAVGELRRLLGGHAAHLLRRPGMIPRVAADYLWLTAGRPRLRGVELAITSACNCACGHCLEPGVKRDGQPHLSLSELRVILADLHRLGVLNINLTGGEPLLRHDLDAIIRAARPRRCAVTVASNGLLLTEATAARLRRLGVAGVAVSIDAPEAEAHDAARGHPGCFAAMLAGVERCKGAGLAVNWVTILTPALVASGGADRIADMARERGVTLTLNLPYPVGRWAGRRDLLPGPAERACFARLLQLPWVRWEGSSGFLREGCPAGREKIYISASGEVFPCAVIHRPCGDLRRERLPAIYRRLTSTRPYDGHNPDCLVAFPRARAQERSP